MPEIAGIHLDWCCLLLQIRLGVRYLKDVLKMKFPELRARAAAAEAEARAREASLPFPVPECMPVSLCHTFCTYCHGQMILQCIVHSSFKS